MAWKDLLKKIIPKKEEEETVEVSEETEVPERINVRIENLTDIIQVDRLAKLLSEGNILFVKVKELQRKDIGQFQSTLQKLKRTCLQNNWDIVGLEDGYLVITPKFAKIQR